MTFFYFYSVNIIFIVEEYSTFYRYQTIMNKLATIGFGNKQTTYINLSPFFTLHVRSSRSHMMFTLRYLWSLTAEYGITYSK